MLKNINPSLYQKLSLRLLFSIYFELIKDKFLLLIVTFVAISFGAFFTTCYAYLLGPFLKFLFLSKESNKLFLSIPWTNLKITFSSQSSAVYTLISLILGIALFKGVSDFVHQISIVKLTQSVQHTLRVELFSSLVKTKLPFLWNNSKGDYVSRITNDLSNFTTSFLNGFLALWRDILQLLFLASLALYMEPLLFLIAIFIVPAIGLLIYLVGKKVRQTFFMVQKEYGKLTTTVESVVQGMITIRSMRWEEKVKELFSNLSLNITKGILKATTLRGISSPLNEIMGALALNLTLLYAWTEIKSGNLLPENFISFFGAIFLMYKPVKNLSNINITLQGGLASFFRIKETLNLPHEKEDGKIELGDEPIELSFKDVYFKYPQSSFSLKKINISIRQGEKVAIVGESGSGKSTLALLLLKYLLPDKGEITINGININEIKNSSLRSKVLLVPQSPLIMNGSILENIKLGYNKEEVEKELFLKVIELVGLKLLLTRLPQAEYTMISQDGDNISGGEKQKICLARVLLEKPKLLILDESLSFVDSEAESKVIENIESFYPNLTLIIISHRLSTIKKANKIFVLKEGEVVEEGELSELLELKGHFYKLVNSQLII